MPCTEDAGRAVYWKSVRTVRRGLRVTPGVTLLVQKEFLSYSGKILVCQGLLHLFSKDSGVSYFGSGNNISKGNMVEHDTSSTMLG